MGRAPGSAPVRWPPTNEVWRGGGLPRRHHHFFTRGKKFRVPGCLSTSATHSKAEEFLRDRGGSDCVLWTIRFDTSRRCHHVNFISVHDGSLDAPGASPNIALEDEFLFSPYSVFTVAEEPVFRDAPTPAQPHLVVLLAAIDNKDEPETVELAPWS